MPAPSTRDYFAEMYVAGLLGDARWNVFFPKRDQGFDMIATKGNGSAVLIRPIQVKGLYPQSIKKDKKVYGYVGRLSQVHSDMALVLVYFGLQADSPSPSYVAWMPRGRARQKPNGTYVCQTGRFIDGQPSSRRDYTQYFGSTGLERMSSPNWR